MDRKLKNLLASKLREYIAVNQLPMSALRDKTKHDIPISLWLIYDLFYKVKRPRTWKLNKQRVIIKFLGLLDKVEFDGKNYKLKEEQ